ncbi:hypothetical protein IHV25_01095 [Phaeovibrio sulfidiphilus]|uniref:Lipoprotein n=1 Tax=Phaeovibrio sulfidiphilus TaxID=1220600 RepID=A0A8J6YV08_9PROT|nr:hypothetical protein [Phaeovibrio sulfidiphilus]MBE1236252.1 hypothetical protein [Phaeovibrio sulfidiphilus]
MSRSCRRSGFRAGSSLSGAAVLFLLGGCNAFVTEDGRACPHVRIDAATAQLVQFGPGPGRDVTDERLSARVLVPEGGCAYDSSGVTVDMNVSFQLELGPAARDGREAAFEYFVAIPEFYPSEAAKQVYPVSVRFPDSVDRIVYRDERVEVRLPLEAGEDASGLDIYVGLQLTEGELRYNQARSARQP